jgi:hypothetical protein
MGTTNEELALFCSFGFRRDGGAVLTLLINNKDYATIELEPKDIRSMYSTLQMAEAGLFDKKTKSIFP